MKNLILIFLLTLTSLNSNSAELKIEPVYGVERTQRQFPKPARYRTETFIGARALYGTPIFSAELELNTSTDTEEFPDEDQKVKYNNQKVLLGFRSYPITSEIFGLYLRFGARASKQTREITQAGSTTKEEDGIILDPYAGTGVTISLANAFALNAGATLVYNRNALDSEKFDTRYTLSFTIKAGSK